MSDVTTKLLDLMRVQSTAFVGKNLQAPWAIKIEEQPPVARFHLVLSGSTYIELPNRADPIQVRAGEMAIIPHGREHLYKDRLNRATERVAKLPDQTLGPSYQRFNPNSEQTHLLCGYFTLSDLTPPAIMNHMPDVIVANRGAGAAAEEYDLILSYLKDALRLPTAPSQTSLNRLTEILCVHAMRGWLTSSIAQTDQLRALADPRTGAVLDQIHKTPEDPWTVDSLADLYGLSRAAFSAQFKRATGLSPMGYVRRFRMQRAAALLRDGSLTIDEIAFKSGYSDTNAFSRAFRRETGASPGTEKREARARNQESR